MKNKPQDFVREVFQIFDYPLTRKTRKEKLQKLYNRLKEGNELS